MSFEDLPSDWPDIPLADPTHIADVLDLFVSMQSRMDGVLLVLVCDSLHRPVQPILLHGIHSMPFADAYRLLPRWAEAIAGTAPGCPLLFALARRGGLSVTPDDRRWRRCIEETFRPIPCLGFHVVTPDGSRSVHDADAAA